MADKRRLGAILAGGRSRRFGSDKAAALLAGRPLIEHVADRLRPQCDALVVVGRAWPGLMRIDDAPGPGLGPLGGLAGALAHAAAQGYTEVLTSGCDLPGLPPNLGDLLTPGPAVIGRQPLLGLWPALLADDLGRWLNDQEDRSLRGWTRMAGARSVAVATIANVNTPEDLVALSKPA